MTEPTTSRRLPPIVLVPGVLGLVLAIVGVVLFVVPSGDADRAASQQVIARVNDFAVAYNTYDVADPKDYQQRMSSLLTADYNKEFVQTTTAIFTAIKAKKQRSGSALVRDVAIESIDGDSAVALAVVDAKVTNTDNEGSVLRQFRWTVNLQKVAGQWRISQFESIAAQPADAPTGAPRDAPAPTPTTEGASQ